LAWPSKGLNNRRTASPNRAGLRGLTLLPLAPLLTVLCLLVPVGAGLAGVIAPAFGWFPALGGTALSLDPWRALMAWPGLSGAVWLSITTGLGATLISLIITMMICAAWQGTRAFALIERALSPLLSVPHAAAAFGLAFLIAPSGWVSRAFSPWLTGWTQAPDILITQDPNGFALMAGLIVKEVPFLLLMTLAALGQVPARRSVLMAQTMGYGRMAGWILTVFPRIYPQIRLPVYAVLAYSCAVIDVALILGPTRPSTLAVQVLQWLSDPNLGLRFQAAAGAVLQLGLVLGLLLIWRGGEHVVARLGCACVRMGQRMPRDGMMRALAMGLALITALAVGFGHSWSGGLVHRRVLELSEPACRTSSPCAAGCAPVRRPVTHRDRDIAVIGAASVVISLTLTIACLEAEHRHRLRQSHRVLWLLYLPLIVPQATFPDRPADLGDRHRPDRHEKRR
jgi:putative thiamine transport system permease protein